MFATGSKRPILLATIITLDHYMNKGRGTGFFAQILGSDGRV